VTPAPKSTTTAAMQAPKVVQIAKTGEQVKQQASSVAA